MMPSSESFNFYPRPPRGERRGRPSGRTLKKPFLSTPSARRATCGALRRGLAAALFLSTPSARRATLGANGKPRPWKISIHALREEGDCAVLSLMRVRNNFYPRPPRGGRHAGRRAQPEREHFYPRPPRGGRLVGLMHTGGIQQNVFLSTPSARRATLLNPGR